MPEITCDVHISASRAMVYEALIEQEHVEGWWTECFLKPVEGTSAVFYFRTHGGYARMRIEKLVPEVLVEWTCVDHFFEGLSDWVGTTVRFTLQEGTQGGTDVHFEHLNWQDADGCYQLCTQGWRHHILTSLKDYVEKGKGQPYGDNLHTLERHELNMVSKR